MSTWPTIDEREVLCVGAWKNNAEMIADAARLGYVAVETLDLSYGLGNFWAVHRPSQLVSNDLDVTKADHHHDATNPPANWFGRFGTVVWDPPANWFGTRGTSAADEGGFGANYGLLESATKAETMSLIVDGALGALKCARPGGTVLVKVQDQVAGGKKVWQDQAVCNALKCSARLVDKMLLVTPPRPQPPGRGQGQIHARPNYSTLLVFRRTSAMGVVVTRKAEEMTAPPHGPHDPDADLSGLQA